MDHCGLTVERQVLRSGLWFGLNGELDRLNVASVTTVLFDEVDASSGDVEVDLSGLSFLAVAGVDMIAELGRRLAVVGRHLRITATNGIVDRAFYLRGVLCVGVQMPRGSATGALVGVAATAFAADDLEM